ncbi:hypothetical protein [Nonomuraea dietziae]|uniref:hypothetical protein n=1 Tax=Nonomuraea dietziae TaxID=65515 RepID=UPI0033F87938
MQTTLKASYTNHYRRGLIELLEVLEFRSNNTAHQPVIEALKLVKRYAKAGNTTYYPLGETAPEHKGTLKDWADPGAAHRLLLGPGARWRRHDRAAPDTRQDVHDRHRRAGGADRDVPWVAITPVVNAIRVLERMVPPGGLLFD